MSNIIVITDDTTKLILKSFHGLMPVNYLPCGDDQCEPIEAYIIDSAAHQILDSVYYVLCISKDEREAVYNYAKYVAGEL